ncbi:putative DNA-binding domain-containing protein [Shewanella sp. 202IG2-18]|uniref:HvfC/BufC N-terminal domain-containing protein n=1 Tax=Parashewanella hymeniacidonis TaxID=2807618 RepID=UPI001961A206|nr:DNA-binding domain-containing protein [Parashewanella hymeniacidonis]MBM7074464.1 putative DNA-binding domain-containing protein [Parashewanella hymeniacidonis]
MSQLRELQEGFFDYILEANLANNNLESHPFNKHVVEQGNISANTRLVIYANAYYARLRSTIETDHDILAHYLGDDWFEDMVRAYINSKPSKFKSLRQFCEELPEFLATTEPFSDYPQMAEIARFERRLLNSFDAGDTERASFSDLQALPPEQWPETQLRFHPSVQLFTCESNAVEIWQAVKAEQTPPEPDMENQRHWLLWRGETRLTEFTSITPYQFVLIDGFIRGANFAQQCEAMLEYFDESQAPMEVLQALQAWFEMGLIKSIA